MIGPAWEGFYKAKESFKEGCGSKFESWAERHIRYAICDHLKAEKPKLERIGPNYHNPIEAVNENIWQKQIRVILDDACDHLTWVQRQHLIPQLLEGKTIQGNRRTVNGACRRGKLRARKYLEDKGLRLEDFY